MSDESKSDSDNESIDQKKGKELAASLKRSDTKKITDALKDSTSYEEFVAIIDSADSMRAKYFFALLVTNSGLAKEKITHVLTKKDLSFIKDKSGYFPFIILTDIPSELIYLLQGKIDPNFKSVSGETALTLLVRRKVDADLSFSKSYVPSDQKTLDLIAASADDKNGTLVPAKKDSEQTTSPDQIVSPELISRIKALRAIGADPMIQNKEGKSALDLAGNNTSLLKALVDEAKFD